MTGAQLPHSAPSESVVPRVPRVCHSHIAVRLTRVCWSPTRSRCAEMGRSDGGNFPDPACPDLGAVGVTGPTAAAVPVMATRAETGTGPTPSATSRPTTGR